ncbi:bifunctional phosphoribosylaminoimidazolecarboxamide formyltransferase/IMP cyclohydrolase [candidate division LCP-89 bacterium B3_LCP]|uniref:Bifunctional purine biosynthesis protein PurH n=1 Tax=candidate division LCP-89 bacterium B3_LCP TaxID=2012998 RepID=A0A532V212_UNCL8|nr:MAG: bifunctional phosphoribosylaminoimidazolecarboxamide formyltransferase/IMP cyclohydrolase [candidate division LCP-89 bacterium B3_LCP]
MQIKNALISVYDKTKVTDFARDLVRLDVNIISTGGTSKALSQENIPHRQAEEITNFPEILDGRVKTLHPHIHAGILFRRNLEDDKKCLTDLGIDSIDLIAVNLYPFARTAADPNASHEDVLEMIDIGGPSMLRAAAKNYPFVLPICIPSRYADVIKAIEENALDEDFRRQFAAEAFHHTTEYDRAVAAYLTGGDSQGFPEDLIMHFHQQQSLRYGENPHQKAAFYLPTRKSAPYQQLWGKELSFNNLLDLEAAAGMAADFDNPCVILVKHTVPCGAAVHSDPVQAYKNAFATDTSSPFGGIVGLNHPLSRELAQELSGVFYEVVVAPAFDEDALEILRKKKNLRLIKLTELPSGSEDIRSAMGGLLVQEKDGVTPRNESWTVATKRQPTEREWAGLEFAWKVCRWAKSNSVVFASADCTLGIGLGQTSRVDSVELAVARAKKYGPHLKGSVLASDAFFPFPDGAEAAVKAGATAIIQPGGSMRDKDVIEACDKLNVAMVFTGERHFRH